MEDKKEHNSPPFSETLKTIPDILGIRLNEHAKYVVIYKEDHFEIRRYEKCCLAQIHIKGPRTEAIEEGFTHLADYIFGDNTTADDKNSEIKMAMTAPVYHEFKNDGWLISFLIPAKYNLETAPRPIDKDIYLIEKPAKTVVAYEYSGNNDGEKRLAAQTELQKWLYDNQLIADSDVYWAQYDPPFTVPFLKRNEVLIKIADGLGLQ